MKTNLNTRTMAIQTSLRLVVAGFCLVTAAAAQAESIALEDFENDLAEAPAVKTGWESKSGEFSSASMQRSTTDVKRGAGAGEIKFDVKPGSWALVQKKYEGAEWLKRGPKAISFWLRASGAGKMTVELEESYTFKWRKDVPLTDTTWHFVKINLKEFQCDDKRDMSSADLVDVKFVFYAGTGKIFLDDIQFEFEE